MLERVYIIYDNSCKPNYDIENIIGDKSFAQIIYKRRSLRDQYLETIKPIYSVNNIIEIEDIYSLEKIVQKVEGLPEAGKVIHLYSDNVVRDNDEFLTVIQKGQYIKQTVMLTTDQSIPAIFFNSIADYLYFLKMCISHRDTKMPMKEIKHEILKTGAFLNLNNLSNFLQYMTGGFEARFFNSLRGDEYTVTKTSTNKKKIKSEYTFYHLLPEEMKQWFVLPYNYVETEDTASYTMERLHITDIAIRWIHGAISLEEFRDLLNKVFYFVNSRKSKEIGLKEYDKVVKALYLNKVEARIEDFKKHKIFPVFENYISSFTKYSSIDEVVSDYRNLFEEVVREVRTKPISVIGHGDLCFSNMLYNKDTKTLKLIDTKGALVEEELWTNPYYDIAKLSHSICGKYDFFNSGMFEIILNENIQFKLTVDCDSSKYVRIFKEYLEVAGYSYKMVRVFETSLFLSMLPLHMDNPQKVFGFLLNAINIMEDIKNA
jgi:hypothetical protein